jgi:peptide/nickel transport system substrate-binding protein
MNVDYVGDRLGHDAVPPQQPRTPVEQGGWSAFVTGWEGMDWLNPAGHIAARQW